MSDQTIIGGYELKNCVATGTATQIWEVVEQGGTQQMAMKLLLPEAHKEATEKNVLKHEYKVGASLEHPAFLRFHKLEVNRDHGFFIMDYYRAPSMKSQMTTESGLAELQSRMKKITESLTQAYAHMHEKGWLHRDIKPENILSNKAGEVRVIDFSLSARVKGAVAMLISGKQKAIQGTRTYIAPETILKKPPTIQADIYSLGVTLYEMAVGFPPFAGMSPSDLLKKHINEVPNPLVMGNPNTTPELNALIQRMLAKKPKDRPADMKEVMSMFRNIKFFLEDPMEAREQKLRAARDAEAVSVDKRLDSRADHDRTEKGLPSMQKQKGAKKRLTNPIGKMEAVVRPKDTAAAAPIAQQQPMMMPQQMMMPPQMMMPQMMPPGYPGQMPMPGYPQMMPPGGYPGQMPMPGYPQQMPPQQMPPQQMPPQQMQPQQMPPQQMPPQQMPPQQMQPQQMPPQQMQPQQMQPQQMPPQQMPPQQQEAPRPRLPLDRPLPPAIPDLAEADEMDFMTELPDVI